MICCLECGRPIEEGNHATCYLALLAKLAAAIADKDRLMERLIDAGIMTRRR